MRKTTRDTVRKAVVVWVTAVLTLVTATALMPVAVNAAGTLMTIVDDNTNSTAQVDGGALRVGDGSGRMTVDGIVHTRDSWSAHRTPYTDWCSVAVGGTDFAFCEMSDVPAGKLLIVQHVSIHVEMPNTQTIHTQYLDVDPYGSPMGNMYLPFDRYDEIGNGRRVFTTSEHGEFPLRANTPVNVYVRRTGTTGTVTVRATISGYLIPRA